MVLAHPVSATGQLPTTYVTWMAGRSPLGEGGAGDRESHIVILDNGRRDMRNDPKMREALHCIRCGACMNICPTYGVVGGHTFGYIYPGPIGIPWTAECHGLDRAAQFAPLCISCGLCKEICPADIDIPMMIAEVKHRARDAGHGESLVNRMMMAADAFAKLGSAAAPFSNWALRNGLVRRAMAAFLGIDPHRALPPFTRNTLAKRMAARTNNPNATRRVAFFADVYANFNDPDIGMLAIEYLERNGCEVLFPPQKSSGYPYIAYGDLVKATETARYNVEQLAPLAREGVAIISPEPTAVYALKKSYPKLLGTNDARLVADHTYELFDYLLQIESEPTETSLSGQTFGFHCACHQRPIGSAASTMEWLRRQGANVKLVETGTCCGMGGTFGLKAGPLGYDLSMAVGKNLFDAFREANVDTIVTESSVCAIQLAEGTNLPVVHPLSLLPNDPR
jgi:Fe-S oxidoreductase